MLDVGSRLQDCCRQLKMQIINADDFDEVRDGGWWEMMMMMIEMKVTKKVMVKVMAEVGKRW